MLQNQSRNRQEVGKQHDPRRVSTHPDLDALRELRAELERYHNRRTKRSGWTRCFVPTGLMSLDDALPHGGVPRGAITEILSNAPGVGAMSLAFRIARRCSLTEPATSTPNDHGRIVFVDTPGDFYPPAAWLHGIDPARLIVIRPTNERDAFWATDQSLRCSAVTAVIASLEKIDDRQSRRLQLAAESSGCVGLILRSSRRVSHSFAAVRLLVEGVDNPSVCDRANRTISRVIPLSSHLNVDLTHAAGTRLVHPLSVDRSLAHTG